VPLVAAAALLLAGCGPLSRVAAERPTTEIRPSSEVREPDCSRRFDDNDAGFQTCES
jgi:hypothetical protein